MNDNETKNYFGHFFAPVKIAAQRLGQIISVIIIASANPKMALEREINYPSHYCRQVRPKVNGDKLTPGVNLGHQIKKKLFLSEIFLRE